MTLQSLITRVEAGSGSDRQLDVQIIQALHPSIGEYAPHCPGDDPIFWHEPFCKEPCPHLTSSLDAIRALFKARLDGCCLRMDECGNVLSSAFVKNDENVEIASSGHTDIHRAFLSAVLKAIAAKEGV